MTRVASLVLATGLFFALSCTHFDRSTDQDSDLDSESAEQQLELISEELSEDPENTSLKLQKADLLIQVASDRPDPQGRTSYYRNLKDLSDQHRFSDGEGQDEFDLRIVKAWSAEQGEGVRLLQQFDPEDQPETERIVAHLENAILVNPDSLSSYNLLANTHYRTGEINKAISTLEEAKGISPEPGKELREKMAYLYLESGNVDLAISIYEELAEMPSPSAHIRHGLANAYMLNRQHTDAIRVLTRLTEEFPSRYEYQEALATESSFRMLNDIAETAAREELTDEDLSVIIEQTEQIDGMFATLSENLPSSEDHLLRSGAFYKNIASKLSEIESFGSENQVGEIMVLREDLLNKALPYWKQLAENHSDNPSYIHTLHQLYLQLDMEEEAESLERTFNL